MFNFHTALVRNIPESFLEGLKLNPSETENVIDLSKAKEQHENYIKVLESLIPQVRRVPQDNRYPDSNFIEDTALIIGHKVLLNFLGAPSRRGEIDEVAKTISKDLFSLFLEMFSMDYPAKVDGGDVLFTGKDIFVGLTTRTNLDGMERIRAVFGKDFPVHPIPFDFPSTKILHLKSLLSQITENILVIAETPEGHVVKEIISNFNPSYQFVFVPDTVAANVLRINNTLIIQKGFLKSEEILNKVAMNNQLNLIKLEMSELIKADGALTCGSLLIQ